MVNDTDLFVNGGTNIVKDYQRSQKNGHTGRVYVLADIIDKAKRVVAMVSIRGLGCSSLLDTIVINPQEVQGSKSQSTEFMKYVYDVSSSWFVHYP